MAKAVEAWTNWDFERFGYELGELFRGLVMLTFPQKYSLDANGRLRRGLSGLSVQAQEMSADQRLGPMSTSVIIGGVTISFLAALLVVRVRRVVPLAHAPTEVPSDDLEVCQLEELEEFE